MSGPDLAENLSTIQSLIEKYTVPVHPEVVDNLQKEFEKSVLDLEVIASLVQHDPSIASGVIQVANSIRKKGQSPESILLVSAHDAVDYLGAEKIEKIIQTVIATVSSQQSSNYRFDRFWDSSTDVAVLAHHLAHRLAFNQLEEAEAYTLGLFRDCGIPIMMQAFPDYVFVLREANISHDRTIIDLENEYYDFNHQMVGYCLSKAWNLPEIICRAILTHHDIEPSVEDISSMVEKKNILVSLVYIGEIISNRFRRQMHRRESGEEWPDEWPPIHPYILGHLDVDAHELEDIMEDMLDEMEDLLGRHQL